MIKQKKERPRDADGELLSDQYATPWDLVDECINSFWQTAGRTITIDAFANAYNAKAPLFWTRKDNALTLDWKAKIIGAGFDPWGVLIWGQPPYSQQVLGPAVRKMYAEAKNGITTLALLPVSTSTGWWHDCIEILPQDHKKFLKGRRNFIPPPGLKNTGSNNGDSVTVLFHPHALGVFEQ